MLEGSVKKGRLHKIYNLFLVNIKARIRCYSNGHTRLLCLDKELHVNHNRVHFMFQYLNVCNIILHLLKIYLYCLDAETYP